MSHTPIDYYQSFDAGRTEAESPATLQDSRIAASYSVARIDGLPQSNEYLSPSNIPTSDENDQIMQNSGILTVGMDSKPAINAALAVAMLHNGEMNIDNNHISGLIDNQNSAAAAAAAAAAVAAASSSVQPQLHQNALQSLAKPMPLRNNQHPPSSDALLQSQRGYAQQTTTSAPQLQTPIGVACMSSIHGASTSGSPPVHTSLQLGGQIPQATGLDNTNVHGVIDEMQSGGAGNQMVSNNGNGTVIPPVSMPTSVIKVLSGSSQQRPRSEKKPIPEDMKDDKYFERRKRNNMAAKKSRDARKQREDEIAIRASFLEKENAILRAQVATLRDEANSLRQLLLAKRTNRT